MAMLYQSLNKVETILDGIADAVTVQQPDDRLIYANRAAAVMIGYPSVEALLDAPLAEIWMQYELFDETGRPLSMSQLPGRAALEGRQLEEMLLSFRRRGTEELRWSQVKSQPIFDDQGKVLFAVNIFRDVTAEQQALAAEREARTRAEVAQRRLAFLAEASELLAESLDYTTTLQQVARLAVPHIADWCAVDLLEEEGRLDRVAVAHIDPNKVDLAYELFRRYPPIPGISHPVYQALHHGEAVMESRVTDEMLAGFARDEEHLRLMRTLQICAYLVVPLKTNERVLGALILASAESGRSFSAGDRSLAMELARRAAQAVERAELYRRSTRLNQELEQRVAERTAQLEANLAELERADLALQKRERQLVEAQRMARLGSWEWDVVTNQVTWSEELNRIYGLAPGEFGGTYEAFLEHIHPEDRAEVDARIRAALEQQSAFACDERIVLPDGSIRILRTHGQFETDGSGTVVRLLGTCQDITEQKEIEQALRESQALYEALAANIPNGAVLVIDKEFRYQLARGTVLTEADFVGDRVEGRYVWETLPRWLAEKRMIRFREAFAGNASIEEVDLNGRTYVLQTVPLPNKQGEIDAALVLSQDVTEFKEAEETSRALLQLSEKLNATLDLDVVVDMLIKEAIRLTGAESGLAGLMSDEGLVTRKYFHRGVEVPIDEVWSSGRGIPGWVLAHGEPYLTNDVTADPLVIPEFVARFGLKSVLSTPVVDYEGEVLGFFEVNNKQDNSGFTASDRVKLMGLSRIAAIAIQNAQLYERQRRLSQQILSIQEEERARLSRELHDSAGQLLTALSMQLALLAPRVTDETVRRELLEAKELATEVMDEIRVLSHELRPPSLTMVGLSEALKGVCQDFARRTGLNIQYDGEPVPTLPDQVSLAFYRFLQETLTNVLKHAEAKTVQVSLRYRQPELELLVEDDGRGFNAGTRMSSTIGAVGVGLLGLQERFNLLDGQVIVNSTVGAGTRVAGRCRV